MTRQEFIDNCRCYNGDEFTGFFANEETLDELTQKLKTKIGNYDEAEESWAYDKNKVEAYFDCKLNYIPLANGNTDVHVEFNHVKEAIEHGKANIEYNFKHN